IKLRADGGVVYRRVPLDRGGEEALAALFKHACARDGADVDYVAIGGAFAEPALRSIAWESKYLVVGFAAGEIPKIPLNLALLKGCDIVGVFWGAWVGKNPKRHQESVAQLLQMYADGKIKPYVSERFTLENAGDA